MRRKTFLVGCAVVACAAAVGASARGRATGAAPVYRAAVVAAYRHDSAAFTEGLAYRHGVLLEGTGLPGASALRRVVLATGRVVKRADLPEASWGEGVTVLDGRVFQLTLFDGTGYVYDEPTFRLLRTVRYPGEGWGLTNDGKSLIMSDGSDTLRFLDPVTFAARRTLAVHDGTVRVSGLNELELVAGLVCANVFLTERIVCADPGTGAVRYWLNLADLRPSGVGVPPDAAPNGIAYDATRKRLFVTGKWWPMLFEIRVPPAASGADEQR